MTSVVKKRKSSLIKNIDNNIHERKEKVYKLDENELRVFENFLSEQDFSKLKEIILDYIRINESFGANIRSHIRFGHTSVGWHPYTVPHWNFNLQFNDFFSVYIFSKIKAICDWTKDLQIKRIYCSCQTSEQMGNWHYDDKHFNAFTFTLYCNIDSSFMKSISYEYYKNCMKSLTGKREIDDNNILEHVNKDDQDGYFHIKYSNSPIRVIKTSSNSAVLFNSTCIHNGDCPKYNSDSLRCVIAYKLYIPDKNNKIRN